MRSYISIWCSLMVSCITGARYKRFLNAEVNNRIDVLSQSHQDLSKSHQDTTNWLHNMLFGSTLMVSVLFLLLVVGVIFLCCRLRTIHRLLPYSNSSMPFPTLDTHRLHSFLRSPSTAFSSYPVSTAIHSGPQISSAPTVDLALPFSNPPVSQLLKF